MADNNKDIQREISIAEKFIKAVFLIAVLFSIVFITDVVSSRYDKNNEESAESETLIEEAHIEEPSLSDISVPLALYIVRHDSSYGSERSVENVQQLVGRATHVWEQGGIEFSVVEEKELVVTDGQIAEFLKSPTRFISALPEYEANRINVFLFGSLDGINGIAYGGLNSMAVADITTVLDFRTFAHEVGHLLSLEHSSADRGMLMFQGANGLMLSLDEIKRAREVAMGFE